MISSLEPLAHSVIFTDFTVLVVTLRKTAEDVNHLTINSGLHAIKKKCFPFRNRCDRRIVKQSKFFSVKRERFTV